MSWGLSVILIHPLFTLSICILWLWWVIFLVLTHWSLESWSTVGPTFWSVSEQNIYFYKEIQVIRKLKEAWDLPLVKLLSSFLVSRASTVSWHGWIISYLRNLSAFTVHGETHENWQELGICRDTWRVKILPSSMWLNRLEISEPKWGIGRWYVFWVVVSQQSTDPSLYSPPGSSMRTKWNSGEIRQKSSGKVRGSV